MANTRIPLHPGEFIKRVYIEETGLKRDDIAKALGVHKGTLSKLINGHSRLTSDMAVKLSAVLGRSPESWMNMQVTHALAKSKAEQTTGGWKPKLILNKGELVPPPKSKPMVTAHGRKAAVKKKAKPKVA